MPSTIIQTLAIAPQITDIVAKWKCAQMPALADARIDAGQIVRLGEDEAAGIGAWILGDLSRNHPMFGFTP